MSKKKTLQELTLKDNFMFGAVMTDPENCRGLLELIFEVPIGQVNVRTEKSLIYHPEYKGIRLDVIAQDANRTHYNVEMQSVPKKALGKRARYYSSQIDMDLLLSGMDYSKLPNTYIIFLCDFDPFKEGKYCYTFKQCCEETEDADLKDGVTFVFLSTHGKNDSEVSEKLVKFLEFVKADLGESEKDFKDAYVEQLQKSIYQVKSSREMEERYMFLSLLIQEERMEAREEGFAEGRAEGIASAIIAILEKRGSLSDELREKINEQKDLSLLNRWLEAAISSDSIEAFYKNLI